MVRIASSGMYYPGTTERVVLVAGTTVAVKVECCCCCTQKNKEKFQRGVGGELRTIKPVASEIQSCPSEQGERCCPG